MKGNNYISELNYCIFIYDEKIKHINTHFDTHFRFSKILFANLNTRPRHALRRKCTSIKYKCHRSKFLLLGFCSAYLNNIPTGSSIAAGTGLDAPSSITMGKDGNNYFIFVINTNLPRNVIRYEFGTNLASAPLATNLGDFGGSIPLSCKGFELVNENGKWYGFAVGGTTALNSDMIRFDFGSSLANTPTLATIGNLGGLLLNPQDLYFLMKLANGMPLPIMVSAEI